MLLQHAPALLIILPLIAAPCCVIARNGLCAFGIALTANVLVLAMALYLFLDIVLGFGFNGTGVTHYALGGWEPPTGIEYYIDGINTSIMLLVSFISLLALVFSQASIQQEMDRSRHYLFYTGWLLCLTGLLGICITGDMFNVFVFLEISSLSMYMLIALGKEKKHAYLAAFRYLIMGSIGASFILLGIGFLYAATGTLNMLDLSQKIPAVAESKTVTVAFVFIVLGLFIKMAMFPVFSWLPGAYQYAPSSVATFLSGTATKVSLYVFVRFFFHVFDGNSGHATQLLQAILLPVSVIGFLLMSVLAMLQTDIRRLLAYSSVAQLGYITAAVSMATQAGLTAAIIHIINHGIIKAALFMSLGCIVYRLGTANIQSMGGLFKTMPWTASAFSIAGLALVGVPLTSGFISKWYLIHAALDSAWWMIAGMILVSSFIALLYIGKILEAFYFREPMTLQKNKDEQHKTNNPNPLPLTMVLPLFILIVIIIFLGVQSSFIVDTAQFAAEQLMDGMK